MSALTHSSLVLNLQYWVSHLDEEWFLYKPALQQLLIFFNIFFSNTTFMRLPYPLIVPPTHKILLCFYVGCLPPPSLLLTCKETMEGAFIFAHWCSSNTQKSATEGPEGKPKLGRWWQWLWTFQCIPHTFVVIVSALSCTQKKLGLCLTMHVIQRKHGLCVPKLAKSYWGFLRIFLHSLGLLFLYWWNGSN